MENITNKAPNMIYCVSLHMKNPKRVQTFWFTKREMAISFAHSLPDNHKVTDYNIYEMEADLATEYDRSVSVGAMVEIEKWQYGQPKPRRDLGFTDPAAAPSAEMKAETD